MRKWRGAFLGAFQKGKEAERSGHPIGDCPYNIHDTNPWGGVTFAVAFARAWREGWMLSWKNRAKIGRG